MDQLAFSAIKPILTFCFPDANLPYTIVSSTVALLSFPSPSSLLSTTKNDLHSTFYTIDESRGSPQPLASFTSDLHSLQNFLNLPPNLDPSSFPNPKLVSYSIAISLILTSFSQLKSRSNVAADTNIQDEVFALLLDINHQFCRLLMSPPHPPNLPNPLAPPASEHCCRAGVSRSLKLFYVML